MEGVSNGTILVLAIIIGGALILAAAHFIKTWEGTVPDTNPEESDEP